MQTSPLAGTKWPAGSTLDLPTLLLGTVLAFLVVAGVLVVQSL